ncbi:dienelactone hydrolase family protein [Mycolicibacterium sp. CH28]|uniref:dienelactone hydrolase family protein n=1 Tax=Mycolicibacterium sp. CH28 TaxID=2512237 RepID=UPI0010816F6F|nr:dienelactone hydrolase family protein [Mycolicibacterium sp. CH28]TGD87876.1 dienelactone hydrolase family protein [Mycolicibacterium sp. CH28]
MGKYIDIVKDSGEAFAAYLAEPRSGSGPGIVLLQEIFGINDYMRETAERFAQEGYVVLVPDLFWRSERRVELGYDDASVQRGLQLRDELDEALAVADIADVVRTLRLLDNQVGGVGVVGYCLGGLLAYLAGTRLDIDCAVSYYGVGVHEHLGEAANLTVPVAIHLAELDVYCPEQARAEIHAAFAGNDRVRVYDYPGVDHAFATTGRDVFEPLAADLAYARTLAVLRDAIGPRYDLNAIWDNHIHHEFVTRDVAATMATMIDEPYVNHIPTMTGGVGHRDLSRFYAHHFVPTNPADLRAITISRTVGSNRIVEEQLLCFTHDREMDWLLPGVAPTGKYVEVPLVAIVTIAGDKLCNEHIYWDQASVLVQIGLLDPEGLPVAGADQARKLVDKTLPSNTLMANWASSADKPTL